MFHGIFTVVDVEHDMPLAMEVSMESDMDTMMIKHMGSNRHTAVCLVSSVCDHIPHPRHKRWNAIGNLLDPCNDANYVRNVVVIVWC